MHFVCDNRGGVVSFVAKIGQVNKVPYICQGQFIKTVFLYGNDKLDYERFLHREYAYRNRKGESLIALAYKLLVEHHQKKVSPAWSLKVFRYSTD